jgi:hypothetical protein
MGIMLLNLTRTRITYRKAPGRFSQSLALLAVVILLCSLSVFLKIGADPTVPSNDRPDNGYSPYIGFLQIYPGANQSRILEALKLKKAVCLREIWRQVKIALNSDHYTLVYKTDRITSIFYRIFHQALLLLDRPPPSPAF